VLLEILLRLRDDVAVVGAVLVQPEDRRVTVDGSTGDDDYLRVTIDARNPAVLSWTRVPFTS
jgi:hypothetical protein